MAANWTDPIVAEIRRIRVAHAARFHYDLRAIFQDLKSREATSGRTYVNYEPRKVCQTAQQLGGKNNGTG